jgi:hypothetical protein
MRSSYGEAAPVNITIAKNEIEETMLPSSWAEAVLPIRGFLRVVECCFQSSSGHELSFSNASLPATSSRVALAGTSSATTFIEVEGPLERYVIEPILALEGNT